MPNNLIIPLLLISINVILGVIGFLIKAVLNRIEKMESEIIGLKVETATIRQQVANHENRIVKIENSL